MNYYILFYYTVDNYVERRAPFRELHLNYAKEAVSRGELLLAGALDEPVDSAILIFQGENQKVAENFAESDPYVLNGLIIKWTVRKWNVVIGN